jgi:tripartite-type tricarboxylate transporter receptor subunit TctC
LFPDVKTFNELGFKTADLQLKLGLFVSAKTPPAIVEKLSAAFDKTVSDPQITAQLAKMGLLPQAEDSKTAEAALLQERKDVGEIGKLLGKAR